MRFTLAATLVSLATAGGGVEEDLSRQCVCRENWSQPGYMDADGNEICQNVSGCTDSCTVGFDFCVPESAKGCANAGVKDVTVWAYCGSDLPEGCKCETSWTSDDCDGGESDVQSGCPAEPCDKTTNNETDAWCYVKKSPSCALWNNDYNWSDSEFAGGVVMECDGTCLNASASARLNPADYDAVTVVGNTLCEQSAQCDEAGSGLLQVMSRDRFVTTEPFPAMAEKSSCWMAQDACRCKEKWTQDGYENDAGEEICVDIMGCNGNLCYGETSTEDEWCEVENPAACAQIQDNAAGIVIWGYCGGDSEGTMLPEGCECEDAWTSEDCDDFTVVNDLNQAGCPASPCDAVGNNETDSWCNVKLSDSCPLWQVNGGDNWRYCDVAENDMPSVCEAAIMSCQSGKPAPAPKPAKEKKTKAPKAAKPKPSKADKEAAKAAKEAEKANAKCRREAFESSMCIMDVGTGEWRSRTAEDEAFVMPDCASVAYPEEEEVSEEDCMKDKKGNCKKAKGAKKLLDEQFKMSCKDAGLGCKAKGGVCKYDMKAAKDQTKNRLFNVAKRLERRDTRTTARIAGRAVVRETARIEGPADEE